MDDAQQAKLAQLRAITSADRGETDIQILQSVNWDVQKAVELLFDLPTNPQPTGRGIEQFQVDEPSEQAARSPSGAGSIAVSILSWPLTFTLNLFSYLLRLLRVPVPRALTRTLTATFNWNAFASLWRPAKREPPGAVAERWVRALEDEVGALTWARLRAAEVTPDSVKEIPDFYLGSYGDVLNVAKRELRIVCVVLLSDEHDDVPHFKRETLTDPALNKLLRDEGMLVWGGDVRDIEPYSAGVKLNATTYPFVAFVGLHPARSLTATSAASTQNVLSVLSRHSGAIETTAQALHQHLQDKLLPHMRPVFEKYRVEERNREFERKEREESEQRVIQAGLRDSERILRLREERQRKERDAEMELQISEKLKSEQNQRNLKVASRHVYWKRAAAGIADPIARNTRITIRLPDGRRVLRQFGDNQSLDDLYRFTASELASSLPDNLQEDNLPPYDLAMDGWGFTLVTSYPRIPIPWSSSSEETIASLAGGVLKNGALLVVEIENGDAKADAGTSRLVDDEYLSEEE